MKAKLVKAGCYEVNVGRQRYWVQRFQEGWGWSDPDQKDAPRFGVFDTKAKAVEAIYEWIGKGLAR